MVYSTKPRTITELKERITEEMGAIPLIPVKVLLKTLCRTLLSYSRNVTKPMEDT